jgi:hypothetical protein
MSLALALALGFGLGVLATALAGERDKRKPSRGVELSPGVRGYGTWTAGYLCNETSAVFGAQDSTLK